MIKDCSSFYVQKIDFGLTDVANILELPLIRFIIFSFYLLQMYIIISKIKRQNFVLNYCPVLNQRGG